MPLPLPGTLLTRAERERIHAKIRDTCSVSLMSDVKWRKLVSIVQTIPSIDHYFLKSIRSPVDLPGHGYISGNAPHAFIDTFSFGPIYLRAIEWLEFPRLVIQRANGATPTGGHHQDIDELARALGAAGKFPIEETSRGLRIVGHLRAGPLS